MKKTTDKAPLVQPEPWMTEGHKSAVYRFPDGTAVVTSAVVGWRPDIGHAALRVLLLGGNVLVITYASKVDAEAGFAQFALEVEAAWQRS